MSDVEKNYYSILEIPTNASQREITEGYQKAKNAYSYDSIALYSLMSKSECNQMLQEIEEAYLILSSPHKRRQYDNVKGFNTNSAPYSLNESNTSQNIAIETNDPFLQDGQTKSTSQISKIVANKRFSLEFEENSEFEKEIEQTTEFTGPFLKKIREYKNIDVPRMSEMTKVSKTYIINIEKEDLTLLPALVYVRGFVYQYAKCLKLNPDLVATSYMYRMKRIKEGKESKA